MVGQFQAVISVAKAKTEAVFMVVKTGRCLLGYSTAKDLGILCIGPGVSVSPNCNQVRGTFEELKSKYSNVFQGIGKLKDNKLKLHIDENVVPVAQKIRKVPFSLKSKVTNKVNELLEKDIEKVYGPTTWVSPVVVAPKASGNIRLCVDM